TGERTQVVVVIAGNVDDAHALAATLHQQLQHFAVALRPKKAMPQAFDVDDVADEIQRLAAHVPQEVEQQIDAAGARPQVYVREKDGAQRPALARGRGQRSGFPSMEEAMMRAGSVMCTDIDRKSGVPGAFPRNEISSVLPKASGSRG